MMMNTAVSSKPAMKPPSQSESFGQAVGAINAKLRENKIGLISAALPISLLRSKENQKNVFSSFLYWNLPLKARYQALFVS
jgi:hypothetical protein